MGQVQTKRLLRESMRGVLAERVRARWNKQGFRPPQDLWFKSKPFLALVRDTLASTTFRSSDYWIPGWWDRTLDRVEQGQVGLGWTVWGPLMIEWWRLQPGEYPDVEDSKPMLLAVEEPVRCMENGGEPSSTGEDGVASLEMCMGIYESQLLGGQRVSLPLQRRDSALYRLRDAGQL